MSENEQPKIGSIVWHDLTVPDASKIKDFYCDVIGWEATPHDMGNYHDFDIQTAADGETITGICHTRDSNANIPAQWLIYVQVADVDASAKRCLDLGGQVHDGPRQMGANRFCVVQDPVGAMLALIS